MNLFPHLTRLRGHALWTRTLGPDSVVVDAGAHRGEFSHLLRERFGCRCVLIEANPELAAALRPPAGGEVVAAALGAGDGSAQFVVRDNPEGGGILAHRGETGQTTVAIETLSLATLRRRHGLARIDVLKLDIEGAEFALLAQAPDASLDDIGQITVEFHDFLPEYAGHGLFEQARDRLKRLGFACLPMAFRTHGDVLFLNRRLTATSPATLLALRALGRWALKFTDAKARFPVRAATS